MSERVRAFCTNYIFMQFFELWYTAVHANVATENIRSNWELGCYRVWNSLESRPQSDCPQSHSPQVLHLVAIDKPIAGPQTSCLPSTCTPSHLPLRDRRRQMAGRLFVAYLFNTFKKHSTLLLINFSCCLLMQPTPARALHIFRTSYTLHTQLTCNAPWHSTQAEESRVAASRGVASVSLSLL